MNKKQVLLSGAVVVKKRSGKKYWFVSKSSDGRDWEFPKMLVRNTESSVRAGIRMMKEQGGMGVKVLEEAGRAGGTVTINGRLVPQRYIYYLMRLKFSGGESIGFKEYTWFDYATAVRKLSSKRERRMLRQANKELKIWEKKRLLKRKNRLFMALKEH